MSDELAVTECTKAEAEEISQQIIAGMVNTRIAIVKAYERKAWKALHYLNFEEYASKHLGIEWKADYLRQIIMWGRFEREVLDASNGSDGRKTLTFAEVKQLARLPDGERKAVFDECVEFNATASSARSPKGFLSDLTHIVNRRLKELAPAPSAEAQSQVAPNFKPETIKAAKPEPAPAPPVVDEEDPADYDATAILAEPETLDLSVDVTDIYNKAPISETATVEPLPGAVCVEFTEETYARLKPMLEAFRSYMRSPDITEGELIADIVFAHYQIRKERLKKFEV